MWDWRERLRKSDPQAGALEWMKGPCAEMRKGRVVRRDEELALAV